MKPKLFSFFLALVASVGIAYASVTIDGIAYNFNDTELTAQVISGGDYTGEIVIPALVTYNQTTYSVTSIGDNAFEGCSGLTSVTIPNSVTSIGVLAFDNCTGLTSITIPRNVAELGLGVFWGCDNLTSVIWNAKNCDFLSIIGDTPFGVGHEEVSIFDKIVSFTFGNEVETIPALLCSRMKNLTSITIPNSVTSIGTDAFSDCRHLSAVYIDSLSTWCGISFESASSNPLYYAEHLYLNYSEITNLVVPNDVREIKKNSFYNCIGLTSITIPNNVTSIEANAFCGCRSLRNVLLGPSVKVLEEKAFASCPALDTVTCYSMRPPTVNNAFDNLPYSTIVYVPADYMNTYKMHDFWGLYDVRPLGATSVQITDLQITPDDNTANVVWPTVENAATYEMIIKDKNGVIVCTLIFNANGQLTSIAFAAPGRSPASTQSAGFSFTVTGLDGATLYDLTMTAKDNSGNILQTTTKSFATNGYTAIEPVESSAKFGGQKIFRNGHLFILRDGKTYTVQGQEVR